MCRGQELCDSFVVGLEWLAHYKKIAAVAGDRIPINDVGLIALLKRGNRASATGGAGIGRRSVRRIRASHAVVPFTDSLARRDAEEQSPGWVDIVIFEIDTLQPWK